MTNIERRLLEQEIEINVLKKQNQLLQKELANLDKKSAMFDEMIQLAEKEYKTYSQKNSKG
ncbi:hypothetical protein [Bernardetia sp.]|uniref:hypothetical protein n=1 Tax=Bernardetia sp. TaxID=1937974 RepID=UPI0025C2EEB1|nr:hypothetical protein [Bernardetia sp.]